MTIMEHDTVTTHEELTIEVGEWKMDPSLKQRWVTALRSGKYEQTRGKFYRPQADSYCALGVLCVVGGVEPLSSTGGGNWSYAETILGSWPDVRNVANVNDRGATFTELADYIEANF